MSCNRKSKFFRGYPTNPIISDAESLSRPACMHTRSRCSVLASRRYVVSRLSLTALPDTAAGSRSGS